MKFHPILFSTEMVQAILENRKTQTRRVIKIKGTMPKCEKHPLSTHECGSVYHFWGVDEVACPFGSPGDVLWVRETLYQNCELALEYDADREEIDSEIIPLDFNVKIDKHGNYKSCKIPSIYMPKWACRIFLKIKSIKVERLWDISEEDAKREGVVRSSNANEPEVELFKFYPHAEFKEESFVTVASVSFFLLWESINGRKSWESNPWVWVIEFERIDKPENFE